MTDASHQQMTSNMSVLQAQSAGHNANDIYANQCLKSPYASIGTEVGHGAAAPHGPEI
jgi:hypothetical protein